MKRFLTLFFILAFLGTTDAQSLKIFNEDAYKDRKTAMYVLGGWALTNMAVSGVMITRTEGVDRSFHQMNVMWNVVNAGIAGASLFATGQADPGMMTLSESITDHMRFQKILLFNAGLDVGYIASGFYLMERSKRGGEKSDQWKGFGQSLLIQGGFLLVFDLVVHTIFSSRNEQLLNFMQDTQLGFSRGGLSFYF